MAITVEEFLRDKGFRPDANPFQWTNAEQEQKDLPGYFVEVPWFAELFGDPSKPESLILFAPQGYGKSSHRLQIAQLASRRKQAPLVVTFTSFDLLFDNDRADDSSERYLALIQEATLEGLMDELQHSKRDASALAENTRLQLHALLIVAAPALAYQNQIYETPPLEPIVQSLRARRFSLKAGLQLLSGLVRAAGFASVYFLIDGIDETPHTRRDPLRAARLLSPLLDAPGALQECGFAFKFFLPANLEPVMREQHIGRLDRLPVFVLAWSDAELLRMLHLRIEAYSRDSAHTQSVVRSFQDLCEPELSTVDQALVRAAQGSPRRMIDLAREIVSLHCQQAATADSLISRQVVQRVLAAGNQEPVPALTTVAEPPASTLPRLYFDRKGWIWMGEHAHCELTGQDRMCMNIIWQNRDKTISYDTLIEALYGQDADLNSGGSLKDRLYKAMRSLRQKLCFGNADMNSYIYPQAGIGYVLQNYCDTPPRAIQQATQPDATVS